MTKQINSSGPHRLDIVDVVTSLNETTLKSILLVSLFAHVSIPTITDNVMNCKIFQEQPLPMWLISYGKKCPVPDLQ